MNRACAALDNIVGVEGVGVVFSSCWMSSKQGIIVHFLYLSLVTVMTVVARPVALLMCNS